MSGTIVEHGPSIGTHHGKPIPEFFIDDQGVRHNYVGLAPEDPPGSGRVNMETLDADVSVISPGLLYRQEPA